MRMLPLLLMLCAPTLVRAEAPPPEASDAPTTEAVATDAEPTQDAWTIALGLGFGQQYAGLGANLAGYLRLHGIFSLGVFGSVGLADLDTCCSDWGWNAGAIATWGWNDRIALAVSYGTVWNERERRNDLLVDGITAAVGYEKMTSFGLWLRWMIGVAFPTGELQFDDQDIIPSMNVGVGWKI